MHDFSEVPEPVQWYEGMLLAPQHFQQAWLHNEASLGYTLMQTGMYPWGIKKLSVDRTMLAGGRLRLLSLEAILPDGLAILHPRNGEPYLDLDLAPYKTQMAQGPMAVHIAVPAGAARPGPGDLARWRSVEGGAIADANTRDNPLDIPRLRPNLSLIATNGADIPPPNRYVAMPIAKISYQDDTFVLAPFAPPRPDFPASGELSTLCRTTVQKLRDKAASIADRVQGNGELPSSTMTSMLRSVVTRLPQLEALLQNEQVHPFHVYLALCNLIGSLSWLSGQPVPPSPPAYRHEDALPAFSFVCNFIKTVLDQIRVGYHVHTFLHDSDEGFSHTLTSENLGGSIVIGARAPLTTAPAEVAEWLHSALIGSASKINSINARRIRGADRIRIDSAEELGLKAQSGMVLFRVTVSTDYIVPGEPLLITGTGAGCVPESIEIFEIEPTNPNSSTQSGAA